MRFVPTLAAALAIASAPALAPALAQAAPEAVAKAPPAEPYKAVSELVPLPDFIPGMGSSSSIPRRCRPAPS